MIDLSFELVGKGWAEVIISNGEKEVEIVASYLSDGLKALILAVVILFEGANNSSCSWQDEPGEFQWFFSKEEKFLTIKIITHEKNFASIDINNGPIIFEGNDDLNVFGHRILNEFEKLYLEFGEKGYKKNWSYDYPFMELNRLRQAIKNFERDPHWWSS